MQHDHIPKSLILALAPSPKSTCIQAKIDSNLPIFYAVRSSKFWENIILFKDPANFHHHQVKFHILGGKNAANQNAASMHGIYISICWKDKLMTVNCQQPYHTFYFTWKLLNDPTISQKKSTTPKPQVHNSVKGFVLINSCNSLNHCFGNWELSMLWQLRTLRMRNWKRLRLGFMEPEAHLS